KGWWWTPARPSLAIDDLRLSDLHYGEPRSSAAVLLEWNRLDFYSEGELRIGSSVYVGRSAPQQENMVYGGTTYLGGGIQFRLTTSPEQALFGIKQHKVR